MQTNECKHAMHSTKTAVLKVLSDILLALDSGNLVMLTLLDLSAAFDSVDHETLLKRLHSATACVLWSWRTGDQLVYFIPMWPCSTCPHIGDQLHTICDFVRNTARISSRADSIPSVHCRPTAACETPPADDTQIYGNCRPADSAKLTEELSQRGWCSIDYSWIMFFVMAAVIDSIWPYPHWLHRHAASIFCPWSLGLH